MRRQTYRNSRDVLKQNQTHGCFFVGYDDDGTWTRPLELEESFRDPYHQRGSRALQFAWKKRWRAGKCVVSVRSVTKYERRG